MSDILMLIVALAVMVGIFLLFRGIVFWYWNVNTIVENQKRTNYLLTQILESQKVAEEIEE